VRVERSEVGVSCWGSVWRWPAADSLCYIKSTRDGGRAESSGGGGRCGGGRCGEGAGLRSVRVGVAVGVAEQRLRKERMEFGRD
jgi:hypothetical protein